MSSMISRHPHDATLMSFAAGSLPEPLAASVSAHVSMCARCHDEMRDMELIGTELLRELPATSVCERKMEVPNRPTEAPSLGGRLPGSGRIADRLPAPIARKYGLASDGIPWRAWKRYGTGFWYHRLALSPGVKGDLRLVKVAPGCKMPWHGHGGAELTLVLEGAYADESGEFRRGDMQDVDEETEHEPVADKELGCICLFATD